MRSSIYSTIQSFADPKKAFILQRFFKTGKGQYGEGDIFLGIVVPTQIKIAKQFSTLPLKEIEALLTSKIHEHRLIALLILIEQFQKGDEKVKNTIYHFYLSHTKYINNWDLVDLSAYHIVGAYLDDKKERVILSHMARSQNLWDRRIAILSTFSFIKKGAYKDTIDIAKILLHDSHDLIQKAVGWMLREMGKRGREKEEMDFLNTHAHKMPRTMLRYAIERFPKEKRDKYLKLK